MFETWQYADVIVSYVVGTGAGIWLYKRFVQEYLIQQTIDALVQEDFVRSFLNDEDELELRKWYDLDDLLEDANIKIKVEEEETWSNQDLEDLSNEEIQELLNRLQEIQDNDK